MSGKHQNNNGGAWSIMFFLQSIKDTYTAFPEWHQRDLRDMILRDRNHASVILWSIGNEIDYPNDPYAHPSFCRNDG